MPWSLGHCEWLECWCILSMSGLWRGLCNESSLPFIFSQHRLNPSLGPMACMTTSSRSSLRAAATIVSAENSGAHEGDGDDRRLGSPAMVEAEGSWRWPVWLSLRRRTKALAASLFPASTVSIQVMIQAGVFSHARVGLQDLVAAWAFISYNNTQTIKDWTRNYTLGRKRRVFSGLEQQHLMLSTVVVNGDSFHICHIRNLSCILRFTEVVFRTNNESRHCCYITAQIL